jgi:hypothetical protein
MFKAESEVIGQIPLCSDCHLVFVLCPVCRSLNCACENCPCFKEEAVSLERDPQLDDGGGKNETETK